MAPSIKPANDVYQRALACYQAGDHERCRELVEQMLTTRPRDSSCLTLKGMALIELDRVEEAIESLRLATEIAPDAVEAWSHLGNALTTVGQMREAAQAYREALRVAPDHVPVLVDLSHVLFALDDVEQALQTLERARSRSPEDLSLLRGLAGMYRSADRPESALQTTLRLLELQPTDVAAGCDAAWLLLQLNREDEAADLFAKLRKVDGDQDHELYAIHGLVMTEIKRRNWRRALELAIDATRLDRYDFTTLLLRFISSKLFDQDCEVSEEELEERFAMEHRERVV
jgi:tetratricopeptide (TPR) repeat protein